MKHIPVLLNEILEGLEVKDGEIFVDMTLGGGGHTTAILSTVNNVTAIGIDADSEAPKRVEEKLTPEIKKNNKVIFETIYFDSLDEVLEKNNISSVDKILFDLGYSSFEIDSADRGFSFLHDGPLKMTYTQEPTKSQLTAYDVVNEFKEENLADIIYGFGEEGFSRRIAQAIVEKREEKPIETTLELAQIISDAVPHFYRHHKDGGKSKIHPATKTFQAIRIAVNSELERLKIALRKSLDLLSPGGRIAVISFHSLEDRIVKKIFKEKAKEGEVRLVNKKVIIPTEKELKDNPRARSSKLRIVEKI